MPSPFFFPFLPFKKKKKATSTFWGRGDQKAQGKDFDPQVLPHNNTQRPKNITKMIKKSIDPDNANNKELIKKAKKAYKTNAIYKNKV